MERPPPSSGSASSLRHCSPAVASLKTERVAASFRDPSGFVYRRDGVLYRQVNASFREQFEQFLASGLYDELSGSDLLVRHVDADMELAATSEAYRVIRPAVIPFVSYPYEWSFSQLKDAALLTLEIQDRALRRGLVLRDASAYNIQFVDGRPVFIDTLSFGPYLEGEPWIAYRQFCEHFLAPLALMAKQDVSFGSLNLLFSDGVPLPFASRLLDWRSRASLGLLLHVHLHARLQKKYEGTVDSSAKSKRLSRPGMERLIEHLRSTVQSLAWSPSGTEWADYERAHSYSQEGFSAKELIVQEFLGRQQPRVTWDLGANTGIFSQIAAAAGSRVVSIDSDPGAVELNYRRLRKNGQKAVLPLLINLLNPSPAAGWAHGERMSLRDRGPADTVMALALIHHLALSGNVPFTKVASFFAELGASLIIEFVPLSDPQAQRLIVSRRESPHAYSQEEFESAFSAHFVILEKRPLPDSDRRIYLMVRKDRQG